VFQSKGELVSREGWELKQEADSEKSNHCAVRYTSSLPPKALMIRYMKPSVYGSTASECLLILLTTTRVLMQALHELVRSTGLWSLSRIVESGGVTCSTLIRRFVVEGHRSDLTFREATSCISSRSQTT
jgi:hypothetical protein